VGQGLVKENHMKVKDVYRPDAATIDPDHDLATAARRMESTQIGALAVVDEAGQLVGMVSMRDLLAVEAWR
jgi:CBS domain-containing protein